VFLPPAPAPLVAPRNLAPAGEESFPVCACCHSVAEAPLPGGTGAGGCVSSGAALLSGGRGEESRSAPSVMWELQITEESKPHIVTFIGLLGRVLNNAELRERFFKSLRKRSLFHFSARHYAGVLFLLNLNPRKEQDTMTHRGKLRPTDLQPLPVGPLVPPLPGFANLLGQQDCCNEGVWKKVLLVANLSRWMERRRLSPKQFDESRATAFLSARWRRVPRLLQSQRLFIKMLSLIVSLF